MHTQTQSVYSNLNSKYQINFNFYFSKAVNQIVFNQTRAINTISFKDAAIYAESTQYLKRQYFLINSLGHDQIFDRITMLSEFYTGAIVLRYEYPLMVLTKTKDIFLKRLKRYKHMINQQGSSDQSKSNQMSRSIQLHVNTFLDSVDSSELSKKTAQLNQQLYLLESPVQTKQKSFQLQIHHVYNPKDHEELEHSLSFSRKQEQEESFAQKMLKLSKNISLIQMIEEQALELNLAVNNFTELQHLVCDFDQVDVEDTLKKYQKVPQKYKKKQKENKNLLYKNFHFQKPSQNRKNNQNLFIASLDQNGEQLVPFQIEMKNNYKVRSKQMQRSAMSPNGQYQPEWKKRSQFHVQKRSFMREDQLQNTKQNNNYLSFTQTNYRSLHQNSKDTQNYSPSYVNFQCEHNYKKEDARNLNVNNNKFTKKQYEFQNQRPHLSNQNSGLMTKGNNFFTNSNKNGKTFNKYNQSHKNSKYLNTFESNHNQDIENIFHFKPYTYQNKNSLPIHNYQQNGHALQFQHRYNHLKTQNSQFQQNIYPNSIPITQAKMISGQKTKYQSPDFKNLKQISLQRGMAIQRLQHNKSIQNYQYNQSKHFGYSNSSKLNSCYQQQFQTNGQIQKVQLQKLQKKRKIREKAAQLLNRVKSQQYLINRGNLAQNNFNN